MNPSILITPNAVKAGKLYSIIPTDGAGDLDVVRATSATRVNENGLIETVGNNIARLDYSNGSCPSILVEPQRTNLLLNSENLNASSWIKSDVSIINNSQISPDGISNSLGFLNNSSGFCRLTTQNFIFLANTDYCFSFFYKNIDGLFLNIISLFNTNNYLGINLITDEISSSGAFTFLDLKNFEYGFKRLSIKIRFTVDTTTSIFFRLSNSFGGSGGIIDFNKSINIWGAQAEQGSNATSYIPTVASAVTRNADVISKSGISDLIGQTEGTLYLDASSFNFLGSGLGERISLTNGTFDFRVNIDISSNGTVQLVVSNVTTGTSGTISSSANIITPNTGFKIAAAYDGLNSCLYVNGVAFTTIVGNIPTFNGQLSKVEFNQGNGSRPFYGKVNNLIVYKTRLTNTELTTLTTL